jgi:hypothetical protein
MQPLLILQIPMCHFGSRVRANPYLADWKGYWEEYNKEYTDHWCHSCTNC